MSESYTLTAAEAANRPNLWHHVQRGEVRVTRRWYGGPSSVAWVYDNGDTRRAGEEMTAVHGDYEWCPERGEGYDMAETEILTVEAIPESEQSENSPASIERLKARISQLEDDLKQAMWPRRLSYEQWVAGGRWKPIEMERRDDENRD